MKKIVLGLIICLSFVCLLFIGVNTKAYDAPVMIDGASIRTTGEHQGLKFSASVSSLEGITEHGFFVVKGTHTKDEIAAAVAADESAISGDKLLKKEVTGSDLDFHLVVYNILSNSYEQNITALAYTSNGSGYSYSTSAVTRNILTVATAAFEDIEYVPSEFIDRIVCTSTFVLNGGSFTETSSFTIGAYNSGSSGTSGITLCTKASQSSGSGKFWYKVSLKRTSFNKNIFTIVERVTSGNTLDGDKDYDYVIAAYTSSDTTILTSALAKTYVYIPNFAASVVVKTNNNYEEILGTRIFLEPDETLPGIAKQYYNFDGWYTTSNFSDSVQTVKEGDLAQTYYAKFTPITYTLSYDLQGGKSGGETEIDSVEFNVESSAIILPLAGTMSKTDYTFVEWNTRADGTGDAITSIPAGSHANVTAYAIWAADAPVDVELCSADTAALASITPTKFVNTSFTAGRFNVGGNTYTVGTDAFSSISAALGAATANDVIYVFAGTYSGDITISDANVVIAGPNYNVLGKSSRESEAVINGTITIAANGVTLNGIKFTGAHKITWTNAISGLSILNVYSDASGASTAGGRTAIIGSDYGASSLTIRGISLNCNSTAGRNAIALYATINGFVLKDSYISNGCSSRASNEIMRIPNISGVFDIENNEFNWATSNMSIFVGSSSNGCSSITIANNYLHGSASYASTTIGVDKAPKNCNVNIIGNHFKYIGGNTFRFTNGVSGSNINIAYNLFDTGVPYQLSSPGSGTITYTSNKYEVAQTTTTSDVSSVVDKAALITAYKGSAYYTDYGSICVYED